MSERKIICALRKAGRCVPAYKRLLKEKRVDLAQIKDIESFKRLVPIIDKGIFRANEIRELCMDGDLKNEVSYGQLGFFW